MKHLMYDRGSKITEIFSRLCQYKFADCSAGQIWGKTYFVSSASRIFDRAEDNGFGNPCQSCRLIRGFALSESQLQSGYKDCLKPGVSLDI
jgi:hypothetical protein